MSLGGLREIVKGFGEVEEVLEGGRSMDSGESGMAGSLNRPS